MDWANPSQGTRALWGVKDGEVRFRDTVRVGVERSMYRWTRGGEVPSVSIGLMVNSERKMCRCG